MSGARDATRPRCFVLVLTDAERTIEPFIEAVSAHHSSIR